MIMFVRDMGEDQFTVAARRTMPNEQPLAGYTDVPRDDVPEAAESIAEKMRGEVRPHPRQVWRRGN